MDTLAKARDLLGGIEDRIAELLRELKELRAHRREISKVVNRLGGRAGARGRRRGPGRPPGKRRAAAKARGKVSRKKVAKKKVRRSKRTNWQAVVARLGATFTLDDLSRASGKKKPTVNQAVQKLKKTKVIASTGKRGEYKRVKKAATAKAKK